MYQNGELNFEVIRMQKQREEEWYQDSRSIQREVKKAYDREQAKLWGRAEREKQKLAFEEQRKAIYDLAILGDEGIPYLETQNLAVSSVRRRLGNFTNLRLTRYKNAKDKMKTILELNFFVEGREKTVVLNPERLECGGYLLRKLGMTGVQIYEKNVVAKVHFIQLISQLLLKNETAVLVPEQLGWFEFETGKFKKVKEGDLLWKDLVKSAN